MKTGIELIAEERERQISKEGWTPKHDDEHDSQQISYAAASYIQAGQMRVVSPEQSLRDVTEYIAQMYWPWGVEWLKVHPDPVRNLVKAGALIAAEIDRLNRAVASK